MDKAQNMVAIPPGATIREHLVLRGITQEDFARDLGVSEEFISQSFLIYSLLIPR